jgi:DNA replication protein DnaC
MLIHPIIEQLKQIKLHGMLAALTEQLQDPNSQALSFEERLGIMIDREVATQDNKKLGSRLRQAKLRHSQACLADLDTSSNRQLDNRLITTLSGCEWIKQGRSTIITGATGTGKSWLACALGHKACMSGFKVKYYRLSRLMEELMLGKGDGRYLTIVKALSKVNLLILDDWGMGDVLDNVQQQQAILDILDDRYNRYATLITSQYPIKYWHEKISDPTFADAILDRLLGGSSYQVELKGPSLRRKINTGQVDKQKVLCEDSHDDK